MCWQKPVGLLRPPPAGGKFGVGSAYCHGSGVSMMAVFKPQIQSGQNPGARGLACALPQASPGSGCSGA